MSRRAVFALVLAALSATAAWAVDTSVTIDTVTVTAVGAPPWQIVVTGKVTLGTTDTYNGIRCVLTDPNKNTVTPFVNFTPPAQGGTADYSAFTSTSVTGNWNAGTTVAYTTNTGVPGLASVGKGFTVP